MWIAIAGLVCLVVGVVMGAAGTSHSKGPRGRMGPGREQDRYKIGIGVHPTFDEYGRLRK